MSAKIYSVFAFTLFMVFDFSVCMAGTGNDLSQAINTKIFKLSANSSSKGILLKSGGKYKDIHFPRAWLEGSLKKADIEKYVSSDNYNEQVTAFRISANAIGLHISSYEVQKRGSAQAAAGRDIFLVFRPDTQSLHKGEIGLGISKKRKRLLRCFSASNAKFLLADINKDKKIDVGVVKEELKCNRRKNSEAEIIEGPYYKQYPIQWYVFKKDHWKYNPKFDRRFPGKEYCELPLVGMVKSPIDYVMELSKKSGLETPLGDM